MFAGGAFFLKLRAYSRSVRHESADQTDELLKQIQDDKDAFDRAGAKVQWAISDEDQREVIRETLLDLRLAADRLFNTCERAASKIRTGRINQDNAENEFLPVLRAIAEQHIPEVYGLLVELAQTYDFPLPLSFAKDDYSQILAFLKGHLLDAEFGAIQKSLELTGGKMGELPGKRSP